MRELKNLIERLTILYPGRRILPDDLPQEFHADGEAEAVLDRMALEERLENTERELVLDALKRASGHKGRAAELLGISRHALKRRLQRLGLHQER